VSVMRSNPFYITEGLWWCNSIEDITSAPIEPIKRGSRLYVRLIADDHALLKESSRARGMAAATYSKQYDAIDAQTI